MKPQVSVQMALVLVIVFLHLTRTQAKKKSLPLAERRFFMPTYIQGKQFSDTKSLPFRKVTQLYSRNSGKHVRVLPGRSIDALGIDGDKYAKLVIESDGFGRVRIRGSETKLYICVDKKRRLRGRKKGRGKKNCVWKEIFADNAYTEFRSALYKDMFLAFKRKGKQRRGKTKAGMSSVQFVQRPWKVRLYKGRRVNHKKLSKRKYVTMEQWKKWRKWVKQRRQKKSNRRSWKMSHSTATTPQNPSKLSTVKHTTAGTTARPTMNTARSRK